MALPTPVRSACDLLRFREQVTLPSAAQARLFERADNGPKGEDHAPSEDLPARRIYPLTCKYVVGQVGLEPTTDGL